MPFPLLLAAAVLIDAKPSPPPLADRNKEQCITVTSPSKPSLSLTPPLMPLKAILRLDESAIEEQEEADLVNAINHERVRCGIGILTLDPLLTATAMAHCREMCRLGYVEHESPLPDVRTPLDRYLKSLHEWGEKEPKTVLVAENIFFCSTANPAYGVAYAHQSLMESPGHRANILEARFTKIGVGWYRDVQGRYWVTEMFLRDAP